MGFWTSQRIARRLSELVERPTDVPPPSVDDIDCNAFTLTVGDEVYVSPAQGEDNAPARAIKQLKKRESFSIPAGQFAFLTTQEKVSVPCNAMAFISIKASIKFEGLVNVSGFHVDPGYHGQLIFSVFNAGPRPVILRRGQAAFLIWYADLNDQDISDQRSDKHKEGKPDRSGLDGATVSKIAGEVHSFQGILERLKEGEKKLQDRLHAVERDHTVVKWALSLLIGLAVAYIVKKLGGV